jgi:hypothetical protein
MICSGSYLLLSEDKVEGGDGGDADGSGVLNSEVLGVVGAVEVVSCGQKETVE